MLYDSSKKHYQKYKVFLDDDIGIDAESQNYIIDSTMDDDCESSNEIIEQGVRKALEALKSEITKKK